MDEVFRKFRDSNYSIGSLGNVRNDRTGRILRKYLYDQYLGKSSKGAYEYVGFRTTQGWKMWRVNRLVYEAFNGPIEPKMVIDHINEIRTDNRLENLQCINYSQNKIRSHKHRKMKQEQEKQ